MATSITTINGSDLPTNSRADINNNFDSILVNKMETSVLDTDTTLAANSNSKVPTQAAVKAYVDAGGNVNASETARGIVEVATQAETNAGTATGGTGASLAVNPSTLAGFLSNANVLTKVGTGATTYDLASASGTQTIAHGLGVAPRLVRLTALFSDSSTTDPAVISNAFALYSSSTQSSVFNSHRSSSSASSNESKHGSTFTIYSDADSKYQSGVITVDATNITITWTKTSTPTGTANLIWEALA